MFRLAGVAACLLVVLAVPLLVGSVVWRNGRWRPALALAAGVLAVLLVLALPLSLTVLTYGVPAGSPVADLVLLRTLGVGPPLLAPALALASLLLLRGWQRLSVAAALLLASVFTWLLLVGRIPFSL
ncbi:hypothetical protein [Deinococcus altitudinis]|uniref:hypothetical protein n=1 Tax=Deinococcus altitudinis TaxID=468914 RepID=UPI00389259C9